MKTYFFKITASYAHKNKLYRDFYNYILQYDRTYFTSERELDNFKTSISYKLELLQKEHHRCKPICLEWSKGYYSDDKDWGFKDNGSWRAIAYRVENCNVPTEKKSEA